MRVYVPTTREGLRGLTDAREVPAGAERVVAPEATEEAEYAALMTAAELSAGLLDGPGRRVVLVAEMPTGADPDAALPERTWAAVHADTADRPMDADPDEALGWFGIQEIPELL